MALKEKILDKIASMKLVNKLIILYISLVAIPFTCIGIYAIDYNFKSEEEKIIRNSNQKNSMVATHVEQNVDTLSRSAYSLLINGKLIEFIGNYRKYTPVELREFENDVIIDDISRIPAINPDINRIRIFTENPYVSESFKYIYKYTLLENSLLSDKLSENPGLYYWVFDETENDLKSYERDSAARVVSLYTSIRKAGVKVPIGVLEVNVKTGDFFREAFSASGNSSTVILTSGVQEKLIYDPSSSLFTDDAFNADTFIKLFKDNGREQNGSFRLDIGKRKFIAVYKKLDVLNLTVYEITSLNELYSVSRRNSLLVILGVAGLLLILSVATKLLTELVLGKTHKIIYYMRRVEKGDMKLDIPDFGKDEIGELGKHFKEMISKLKKLMDENLSREMLAKDAQIKALQSQINAHFLYNVLETIGMMAQLKGDNDIHDSVTALGELMRYSMQWKSQIVTLREELQHVRNYITLLNIRYDYTICLSQKIEEGMLEQQVLKMTLQPIIENAVRHGIEPEGEDATIRLAVTKKDGAYLIEISDNGVGMSEQEVENLKIKLRSEAGSTDNLHGIGLKNVYDRIRAYYGNGCLLDITSRKGCFTKVSIRIPITARKQSGGELI